MLCAGVHVLPPYLWRCRWCGGVKEHFISKCWQTDTIILENPDSFEKRLSDHIPHVVRGCLYMFGFAVNKFQALKWPDYSPKLFSSKHVWSKWDPGLLSRQRNQSSKCKRHTFTQQFPNDMTCPWCNRGAVKIPRNTPLSQVFKYWNCHPLYNEPCI